MKYDVAATAEISDWYLNDFIIIPDECEYEYSIEDEDYDPPRMCNDPKCEQGFCCHTPDFHSAPYTPLSWEKGEICELCWVIYESIMGKSGYIHTRSMDCVLYRYTHHPLVFKELERKGIHPKCVGPVCLNKSVSYETTNINCHTKEPWPYIPHDVP